jgi:hypothetical protein
VLKVKSAREVTYRLPTLSERPGAVVPDPEPGVTTTMIVNPIRPKRNYWIWGVAALYVVAFVAFLLLRGN